MPTYIENISDRQLVIKGTSESNIRILTKIFFYLSLNFAQKSKNVILKFKLFGKNSENCI